jgi:hypothetical protein
MNRLPRALVGLLALGLLLGLAMPALAAEAAGKIKSVDADKNQFVMTDANQKSWTFNHNKDGKVLINDKESKLADLQSGDDVTVTYEKDGAKLNCSMVRATRK